MFCSLYKEVFCLGSIVDLCHYRFSEMDHRICYFLGRLTTNSFAPLPPPHQGLCFGPRWGHSPQTPIIGSRSRARCQHVFGFELPSILLDRRTRKFLEKMKNL